MSGIFNCRVIFVLFFIGFQTISGLKLKYLNVVFRHGERTPLGSGTEVFPTNPYLNWTFSPYGPGQLTNQGKQRVYDLGIHIREQYDDFLGNTYHPSMIRARSSDTDRTKMSLQLAMAGIFPPSPPQRWNASVNWQPVVLNYVTGPDVLLQPTECEIFNKALNATMQLPEVEEKIAKFDELKRNLTEWTGKPIITMGEMTGIHNSLKAISAMGLELPKWTYGIFPEGPLLDAALLHYRLCSYNKRMKTLNGGALLKNFTEIMAAKIAGNGEPNMKMNIYGAHDYTVASLLDIFDYHQSSVPHYSSAVFVELLEDDDYKNYVKVYYYKGIPAERVQVNISGCDELCPFDEFIKLFSDVLPTEEDMLCHKLVKMY